MTIHRIELTSDQLKIVLDALTIKHAIAQGDAIRETDTAKWETLIAYSADVDATYINIRAQTE